MLIIYRSYENNNFRIIILFITGSIIVGLCFIISLSLLVLSIPIVREYLEINAINRKINTQKEAIDDLSDSLNEIGLMKSYIENIIGLDSEDKLNSSNIRFMVTGNIPSIKPNNGIISKEFDLERVELKSYINSITTFI